MNYNKKMGLLETFLGWYLRDFGLILFFITNSLRPWTNHQEKHQPYLKFCTQRWSWLGLHLWGHTAHMKARCVNL